MAHLQHKHIIVRADVYKPPAKDSPHQLELWFKDLIESINMKILTGPYVVYCDMPGNKGFTGICAIETSHIALHMWEEQLPGRFELDVYTCGDLDASIIFDKIKIFDPINVQYLILDRQEGQIVVDQGTLQLASAA